MSEPLVYKTMGQSPIRTQVKRWDILCKEFHLRAIFIFVTLLWSFTTLFFVLRSFCYIHGCVKRTISTEDKWIRIFTRQINWYICISSNTTLFLVVRITILRHNYMFRPSNLAIFRLYMRNLWIGYANTSGGFRGSRTYPPSHIP
jgi:hypothetical protein